MTTAQQQMKERIGEIFDYYEEAALGSNVRIAKDICVGRIVSILLDELNETRKWVTKADTVDQVWQQITDRINHLESNNSAPSPAQENE